MNRRGFLSLLGAGVAGVALDQAIPFNRVWSFPKEIVLAKHPFDFEYELLRNLQRMQKLLPELHPLLCGRFVTSNSL